MNLAQDSIDVGALEKSLCSTPDVLFLYAKLFYLTHTTIESYEHLVEVIDSLETLQSKSEIGGYLSIRDTTPAIKKLPFMITEMDFDYV